MARNYTIRSEKVFAKNQARAATAGRKLFLLLSTDPFVNQPNTFADPKDEVIAIDCGYAPDETVIAYLDQLQAAINALRQRITDQAEHKAAEAADEPEPNIIPFEQWGK